MTVKLATMVAFLIVAWMAVPSRRIREWGRRSAIGLTVLATLATVGLGLVQIASPEAIGWVNGPAIQTWIDQQWLDAQTMPVSVWWLLGVGTVLVGSLHSLAAMAPKEQIASHPEKLPAKNRTTYQPTTVGRSELQRALEAMSQAHDPPPAPARERRVEELLPH